MQLEHRIGQLLFVGLPGPRVDSAARELLETIQPGGVLLEERNVEDAGQIFGLTSSIRSLIRVPPLIALSHEGGRLDRLKGIYSPTPSADLLRTSSDASAADRLGEITAEAMRALGFNLNLAPVLDVSTDDSADNGLRDRYLGGSVAEVVRLGGAYIEGLQRGGVIGVGKHFPGLGAVRVSHLEKVTTINSTRDELTRRDMAPYIELFSKINARLNAVLIGHAHYPAFDGPSVLPASMSKNVISGVLREELGFRGLAIAEEIDVEAIRETRSVSEAAVAAIEAGADMVIAGTTGGAAFDAWKAMLEAARNERISNTHISQAFDHIARVKSMVSPPIQLSDMAVSRIRERVAELNLILQHAK